MLSPAQIEARKGKITASRVGCLMEGGDTKERRERIYNLWREIVGDPDFVQEDLSWNWAVQHGAHEEALNLRWFEHKHGELSFPGFVAHPKIEWAGATLDAWSKVYRCPVECKSVGGREPLDMIISRYQPQLQWQMLVTGADVCAISVIMGASEPVVELIEADKEYQDEMVRRARQFMFFVRNMEPPVVLDPVAPPVPATKTYDMTFNNAWAVQANVWLENTPNARLAREAEAILKSMVPEDAKVCFGHLVKITRDRAGRLSLREDG